MIQLNHIYSDRRTGVAHLKCNTGPRTEYQRDFDRLIFSSAFRRLQNKTQVFPLPGSVFVHNRLTHSLEVASVGRSLGHIIGDHLARTYQGDLTLDSAAFYKHDLSSVISAACLCHDIGNPAFGHSGEDAIANYFVQNASDLQGLFSEAEWADLINFEGNANAIRVLTQQQNGKSEGGLKLTYSTLCAIAKYPCESLARDRSLIQRKKFGFFQSEKDTFIDIAASTDMVQDGDTPLTYRRHPFVWITEAADDICYHIVDLEDAHRLGIIEHSTCEALLMELVKHFATVEEHDRFLSKYQVIKDKNERIGYLRARAIHMLTTVSAALYHQHIDTILEGTMDRALLDIIKEDCDALDTILAYSIDHIYNHRHVVEIENAGYHVMYELLDHFIRPTIIEKDTRSSADRKALKLMPEAFHYEHPSVYTRVMGVLDYISGMTDNFAATLYKKIKGIEIGMRV